MNQYLAQIDFKTFNEAIFGSSSSKFSHTTSLGTIISELLKYLFPFAGLLLFIYLIFGGFSYLTSGGEPQAIEQAKGKITSAIIGFLIIFLAYWLVQILEFIFGIEVF